MKYEVMLAPVAEAAFRMGQKADELRAIGAKMQEVVNQLTGTNKAGELAQYKAIFDGSAMADIKTLAGALDAWSRTLGAVHKAYQKARCDSCQEALNALNKIL